MLELEQINYSYPRKKSRDFSVKNISFTVDSGQILTLLGPNGAGKTTIIRIVSGLIIPRQGRVLIEGFDMQREQTRARSSIGLVIGEERTFYYRLSGRQNLEFFGGLYGIRRAELTKRIDEALELVGLADHDRYQYMRYSTGMKKRLNLARALLHKPSVFLLDEPNSGVDPESAQKLRQIIRSLRKDGCTILLTTHNMDEVERLSDEIAFLRDGEIIKKGPVSTFKSVIEGKNLIVEFADSVVVSDSHREQLTRELKIESPQADIDFAGNRLKIHHNGGFDIDSVFQPVMRLGLKVKDVRSSEATLEDVFIKLTGAEDV
jgi:ABC-2 type transport system ATP-binding protein